MMIMMIKYLEGAILKNDETVIGSSGSEEEQSISTRRPETKIQIGGRSRFLQWNCHVARSVK